MSKRMSAATFDAIFGDLSDGAYFAAMEEFGVDPEEFVVGEPVSEPKAFKCGTCGKRFATEHAKRQHRTAKHKKAKPATPEETAP